MTTASDDLLVREYLEQRSEPAFVALYRAHTPYLFGLALRLCGGRTEEAEESVQEGWVRAAQRLDSFQGRSRLRTWLAGFVINCCREQIRRRARGAVLSPVPDQTVQPSPVGVSVDLERLVRALPEGQREVLVLHDVEGYSHREVAAALGIPSGTSKSRLFEARRNLRRSLESEPLPVGESHEADG